MTVGISRRLALLCASILAIACSSDGPTEPDPLASAAPNGVSASPGTDVVVNLSWQDRATVETGFEVHRSSTGADGAFLLVATLAANMTSFVDVGRSPLTAYCYRVRAVRSSGRRTTSSPFSTAACATTFGPPGAVTNLRARPDSGAVFVSWTAAPTAIRYRVERSASVTGPWVLLGEASNVLEVRDSNQVFEQQVCYRVASQGSYGESAASPVCTTPPAPPTGLAAAAAAAGGINLTWTDRSAVEDGFEIWRASAEYPDRPSPSAFVRIGAVPTNAASYHDATAINDTRYWYWVYAKKDGGYTKHWADAQGLNATVAPDAPTHVRAWPEGSTTAMVVATGASWNATGFTWERSTNGGPWVTLGEYDGYDRGLTPDVQVCYRVLAFNNRGSSPPSPEACTAPPRAPTNLVATSAGAGAVLLTWRDESGVEDGYQIRGAYCNDDEGDCPGIAIALVGPNVTSLLLPPGAGRSPFIVVAIKSSPSGVLGFSDPSNPASVAIPPE